jgi:hypothetical protein
MSATPKLTPTKNAAGAHWLGRLVRCCRALGLRNGWRYWKLENKAIRDPGLMPVVCAAIEAGADRLRAEGNEIEASLMEEWAAEARKTNRRFHTANDQAHLPAPAEAVERKKDTL